MFPQEYRNVAFIARHGSWNREQRFGYDVVVAKTGGEKATIEPFMTGMLDTEGNQHHSRPAYVLQMADGSILVSDELHGATYRISYSAPASTQKK
jgi:glucose/arabinose dehydrogenase